MIQISQAHLRVAAGTHPGMRGKENEDRFAVSAYQTNSTPSLPLSLLYWQTALAVTWLVSLPLKWPLN